MKTRQGTMTGAALALVAVLTRGGLHADEAQDKAVQVVQKLGGSITRDMGAKDKPIVGVDLTGTKVTDAGLKQLAALTQLQTLNLGVTRVTGAGLKELAGLTQLQTLELDSA